MSTDLERQLREALHEDAQRARLVNPNGPPGPDPRDLVVDPRRRSSTWRVVAAAAVVAVLVAASVMVTQTRDPDPSPEDPVVTEPEPAPGVGDLFTDVAPGSTVELPPGPLGERKMPAIAWTGTELIVWAGLDADGARRDDGAAFDLATGDWREISSAPIAPDFSTAVWTGTEMIVWGGQNQDSNGTGVTDGAAYNPTTDTWRRLPDGPFDSWESGVTGVWTGDELVVLGAIAGPQGDLALPMAAYDPSTDGWRPLAGAPPGNFELLWTGEAILTVGAGDYDTSTGEFGPGQVMRYDVTSDAWQPAADLTSSDVSLIAVPDADGVPRSVLALAHGTGAPIVVLDPSGRATGTLPGIPADAAEVGGRHSSHGVAVGEEAVFWIRGLDSDEPPARWVLNLTTQAWRSIPAAGAPPIYFDLKWVPEAGVLIGWSEAPEPDGPSSGIVYRPPTPVGG